MTSFCLTSETLWEGMRAVSAVGRETAIRDTGHHMHSASPVTQGEASSTSYPGDSKSYHLLCPDSKSDILEISTELSSFLMFRTFQ